MDSLPIDVRDKIFLKFPINTLLVCTCVSKSWQSYIRSSRFITIHRQQQRRDLLITQSCWKDGTEIYTLQIDDDTFALYARFECPFTISETDTRRIIGSCNGVVCISADNGSDSLATYLWNPTIRRCQRLPSPRITFETHGEFFDALGFGFDPKTNDYKVVRIVELPYRPNGFPLEVDVYNLSTRNWRNISHLASDIRYKFCFRHRKKAPQVHLDGVIYWICLNWKRTNCMVIAFDLGDETFLSFEPPMLSDGYLENLEINVIKGSVCVIQRCIRKCYVWIMKGFGVWEKILDCNLFSSVDRLIGFRIDGKLLVLIRGGLYSYDLEAAHGREPYLMTDGFRIALNLFQQGSVSVMPEAISSIDPNILPRLLKIWRINFLSFHSMGYTESLAMV